MSDAIDRPASSNLVLVVEDEILVRMVVVDQLLDAGFQVEEAGTAAEALRVINEAGSRFGAAILDIGLPDRKGDDLAAELHVVRPDLPIIIASGYDSPELRDRFAGNARLRFVQKPYDERFLLDMLADLGLQGQVDGTAS